MKYKKTLLGLAIITGLYMFPLPIPKSDILTSTIKEITGREVTLGDAKYNLIKNELYLENFKIYEKNKKDIFLSFDSFDIDLDFWPLISKKISVSSINLTNPNINIETRNSEENYSDIIKNVALYNNKSKKQEKEESESFIKSIEISKIRVTKIQIKYDGYTIGGDNSFTITIPKFIYKNNSINFDSKFDFLGTGIAKIYGNYDLTSKVFSLKTELEDVKIDDKILEFKETNKIDTLAGNLNLDLNLKGNLDKGKIDGKIDMKLSKIMIASKANNYQVKGDIFLNSDISRNDNLLSLRNKLDIKNILLKDSVSEIEFTDFNSIHEIDIKNSDFNFSGTINGEKIKFNDQYLTGNFKEIDIDVEKITKKYLKFKNITVESPELEYLQKKSQTKNTKRKSESPIDLIIKFFRNEFFPPEVEKKVKIDEKEIIIPISLEIGTFDITNGSFKYKYPDIDINVSNLNINLKNFTSSKNSKFTLDYKGEINQIGDFYGKNTITLSKDWDFRPNSLNLDANFEFRDIDLRSFRGIIKKTLPNELETGVFFYKGKLDLKDAKLKSENSVTIKNLKLGKPTKVKSVMPLKAELEALKDHHGNIKLDVPISGDFNDPEFNIYKVALSEFMRIILRVTESPLSILEFALNINGNDNKSLLYKKLKVRPEDMKKLEKIKDILEAQPTLRVKFIVSGGVKEKSELGKDRLMKVLNERKKFLKDYFEDAGFSDSIEIKITDFIDSESKTSVSFY